MNKSTSSKTQGFTLVELLVVIAIIAVLISFLLPVILKVRRRAVVLVSPIAYVSESSTGGGIYLTGPNGKTDLQILKDWHGSDNSHWAWLAWSPNGTWVARGVSYAKNGNPRGVVVLERVATGETKQYTPTSLASSAQFHGWADDGHFIEFRGTRGVATISIRSAETGQVTQVITRPEWKYELAVSPVPATTGAYYISSQYWDRGAAEPNMAIVLLNKNFTVYKAVWRDPVAPPWWFADPKVDPMGEYVAWNSWRQGDGPAPHPIATRPLRATSSQPLLIGAQYRGIILHDWTEDGNILATIDDGSNHGCKMVVFDRYGKMLRSIDSPHTVLGPGAHSPAASWRKYMHR